MKYNDGVQMNDDMRVAVCPKCRNNEFGNNAAYCRICGHTLFNLCHGENDNGWPHEHKNFGNARYCEQCGAETEFLRSGLLQAWDKLPRDKDGNAIITPFSYPAPDIADANLDDDELPF